MMLALNNRKATYVGAIRGARTVSTIDRLEVRRILRYRRNANTQKIMVGVRRHKVVEIREGNSYDGL